VRVERAGLAADRLGHAGMAVAHDPHVVVGVKQVPTSAVDQPHALAARRMHRLVVGEFGQKGAERNFPLPGERSGRRQTLRRAELASEAISPDLFHKFEQDPLRSDALAGDITLTVRLWKRPRVKEGGPYGVGLGEIEVDAIEPVPFAAITKADVRRAGEPDRETLRQRAAHAGPIDEDALVYRIEFHAVSFAD